MLRVVVDKETGVVVAVAVAVAVTVEMEVEVLFRVSLREKSKSDDAMVL